MDGERKESQSFSRNQLFLVLEVAYFCSLERERIARDLNIYLKIDCVFGFIRFRLVKKKSQQKKHENKHHLSLPLPVSLLRACGHLRGLVPTRGLLIFTMEVTHC